MKSLLDRYQVDPSKVLFELTETTVMTDIDASKKTLKVFSQYGVGFSIDDFGTGYAGDTISVFQVLLQL